MSNPRSTNVDDDNVTPVPELPPSPADRPDNEITNPVAAEEVTPPLMHRGANQPNTAPRVRPPTVNPNDPPPAPKPATIPQTIRPVFRGNPSDYMATEFLKRCFTCRKEVGEMVDIYMYKDRSFCSDDCRNKEMEKDSEEELKDREKKKKEKKNQKNSAPKRNDRVIFFIGDA